jgi:PTS system cellobiose-specific IIC component
MLVPFQSMKQKTMIPLDLLGAKGIFVGIVTVVITTEICCKICAADITIKMHMT